MSVGGLVYSLIISTNQAINALAWGWLGYLTNPLPSCHSVPFLLTEKQGTTTMAKKATKQIGITRDGREGDGGELQMWFISPENTMKGGKQRKQGDWSTLWLFHLFKGELKYCRPSKETQIKNKGFQAASAEQTRL